MYAAKSSTVLTQAVEYLILDEADKCVCLCTLKILLTRNDRLFELDFLSQTDDILTACTSPNLRKAMFSATLPSGVEEMARTVMSTDAVRVLVGYK